MRARDVAGAAGAGAYSGRGLDHGADHLGVLAHSEVVVGAPDHDVARPFWGMPHRMGEPARDPLEVGENPVAPLIMQAVEGGREEPAVIHRKNLGAGSQGGSRLFRAFPGLLSSRNRCHRYSNARETVALNAQQNLILINTPGAF